VFGLSLKVADVTLGWWSQSETRHRLRLAPNSELRHKSKEFDYLFHTNRLGFRGPDVPFAKPERVKRIVVLGDSFVAGYGVDDGYLMTHFMQQKFSRGVRNEEYPLDLPQYPVEVVNVGRVGTSTIRELDIYESIGRRFHPDTVALAYYLGNDLAEVTQEQTAEELARWRPPGRLRSCAYLCFPNLYLELAMLRQSRRQLREFQSRTESEIIADIRQEAVARNTDPQSAEERYRALPAELRQDVASGDLSEQRVVDSCIEPDRLLRALDPGDADFAAAWERTEVHLARLQAAVKRDGAKFVLILIPAPVQLDRKSWDFHRRLGYEMREAWLSKSHTPRTAAALKTWAEQHGTPCLDLTDDFRNSDDDLYFVEDVHFNRAGNLRAATTIVKFFEDHGLAK
jgi:GDSL-like Lipase/Acylhydrolase family